MELKEIRQLIDLMKKNGLSVFKMEKEDFKITLKTEADTIQQTVAYPPYPAGPIPVVPSAPVSATDAASAAASSGSAPSEDANTKEITSPMVGTFYTSASPESPAYVKVGQEVTPDTVVCIVEAMKVMNEIKAEVSGVITEVCADNGKPVQFGQPLFRVR